MTTMVRNEADIIGPMIDHHLAQGVDMIIVTDNGSTDGTREILEEYRSTGRVDIRDDPVQRKQQASVVTAMARDAFTLYDASWVINADADEFWGSASGAITLRQAFEHIPTALRSFIVPVIDMTGAPAWEGSGLARLVWRDQRPDAAIAAIGLRSHSTPDAVHVGDPEIVVSQGNHEVSIESLGSPDPEFAVEALHLPWRSWAQFSRKVEMSGRAYLANPDLKPSPNHHGMREYNRLNRGALLAAYVLRHPDEAELAEGERRGEFVRDDRLAQIVAPVEDRPIVLDDTSLEFERYGREQSSAIRQLIESHSTIDVEYGELRSAHTELAARYERLEDELRKTRERRIVKVADRFGRLPHPHG